MLLLTSTSDIVRIVTASAVSTITVDAAYMTTNAAGTTLTPGSLVTNITTATTTTIVAAPSGTDKINVLGIAITNNHASSACAITVQKFNGTISGDLMGVTLMAGENLVLLETGEWQKPEFNQKHAVT